MDERMNQMIGIIGAMDVEIDEIKSRVENKTIKTVSRSEERR